MFTLLLGGGSLKNKTWVEEIQNFFLPEISSAPVIYEDWTKLEDVHKLDFSLETEKAAALIGGRDYNLLAKSVGSILAMDILHKLDGKVHKMIICGVPLHDFSIEFLNKYQTLNIFPVENILCFQNSADPHGSFSEAKAFLTKVNPSLHLIEKEGDTHDYRYFPDFKEFLSN